MEERLTESAAESALLALLRAKEEDEDVDDLDDEDLDDDDDDDLDDDDDDLEDEDDEE
jgi:hypothetical protein